MILMAGCLTMAGFAIAQPSAPTLVVEQLDEQVTIRWSDVEGDPQYLLSFAPYPDPYPIETVNMERERKLSFSAWPGAAYYLAVQAQTDDGIGPFSNIEHFVIPGRFPIPDIHAPSEDDGSELPSDVSDHTEPDDDDTVSEPSNDSALPYVPFLDATVFDFAYGDTDAGERLIDSQYASSAYFNMDETGRDGGSLFGVNFADGRIKGYGLQHFNGEKTFFVLYVRDNVSDNTYGTNNFRDNGDGTITDLATGLMWKKKDSGYGMVWREALAYCEDLTFAGYDDWRLPNAKELQSIVDYTRMPDATPWTTPSTPGPAIDTDYFDITSFENVNGDEDWGYFWSSSTHKSSNGTGRSAAYIAFGRALGNLEGDGNWVDVHGAGCQRSDPKFDDGTDYSDGHGPQGDAIYIYNYVRPVRYDKTIINPSYIVVDTNQITYWSDTAEIDAPKEGDAFFGQDAHYQGVQANYTDNGDGTITDHNTGLMWQKSPDSNGDGEIQADDKYTHDEALSNASSCTTGGYTDWRLPTIKELYSLIQFSGEDLSAESELEMPVDLPLDLPLDLPGDGGFNPLFPPPHLMP